MRTPRMPRPRLALLTAAAAAAVTVTVPAAVGQQALAAARQPVTITAAHSTAASTKAGSPATASLHQITLPGLSGQSYTVTLPTGDQVRLTSDGAGLYSVTATPAPGTQNDSVTIVASGTSRTTTSMFALPAAASTLIRDGLVDQRLFDVRWLATHGDTGTSGTLPVTLEYTGTKPAALPGATVTGSTSSTVSLKVRAADAAKFWTAVTGIGAAAPVAGTAARPALTAGIVRAWPTGDQTKAQATPADQTLFTVNENITFTGGTDINGQSSFQPGVPMITGITGGAVGQTIDASGATCLDATCTQVQVTWNVPTGIYMISNPSATFWSGYNLQVFSMEILQLTVAGNTAVSLDADKAVHLTMTTQQPSVPVYTNVENLRTFPNGGWEGMIPINFYPTASNVWVVPAAGVTLGSYHFVPLAQLAPVPVTMTGTGSQHTGLHVTYPSYTTADGTVFTRFSGNQTLPLANAGYGTAQDFAGQDVKGKLVLIHAAAGDTTIERAQMDNALAAGAAGVLGIPGPNADGTTTLPFYGGWQNDRQPAPALPFAEIPPDEATSLISQLQQGTVKIQVTDYSSSSYFYNLSFSTENHVPAAVNYSVTNDQLEQRTANYQNSAPGQMIYDVSVVYPGDHLVIGTATWVIAPVSFQMFYGPVNPEVIWWRTPILFAPQVKGLQALDIMDQRQGDPEVWFDQSEVPGSTTLAEDVFQAQPNLFNGTSPYPELECSFCRQGDTFYPLFSLVSGQSPRVEDGLYAFTASDMHLYQNGTEIPQSQFQGTAVYQLPAQQGTYQLTATAGNLATEWTFTSAHPAKNTLADGNSCFASYYGVTDPCAPAPLILLRYNASANVNNAITAGGKHQLQITSYDQSTTQPQDITSLKFWTSTDGGKTWQQATVSHSADGSFTVGYTVPQLASTSGTLSIRAQAADAAGDTINQTYLNDYTLIASH